MIHDCTAEAQMASVILAYFNWDYFRKVNEVELSFLSQFRVSNNCRVNLSFVASDRLTLQVLVILNREVNAQTFIYHENQQE